MAEDRVPSMLGEVVTPQAAWVGRFMRVAAEVATWSKDENRQVGALVIINKGRSMSPGFNGFPPGVLDLTQRIRGPEKNRLTIHAEVNALNNADFDVRGGELYVTSFPCLACALQIISRGISHVIAPAPDPTSSWHQSHMEAQGMLQEAGVRITFVEMTRNEG